jgi:hypothetical protein
LYWGYIGTFTKCLQYIVVKFTPSIILLYSPYPVGIWVLKSEWSYSEF